MVLLSQKGFLQLGPDVLAVFELRSGRVIGRPLCQLCVCYLTPIALANKAACSADMNFCQMLLCLSYSVIHIKI